MVGNALSTKVLQQFFSPSLTFPWFFFTLALPACFGWCYTCFGHVKGARVMFSRFIQSLCLQTIHSYIYIYIYNSKNYYFNNFSKKMKMQKRMCLHLLYTSISFIVILTFFFPIFKVKKKN
jgi:hypothetical protein